MKNIFGVLKETFTNWSEDNASRLAAAMSYYTLFSLAPLLVIAIAIAGLVFGRSAAQAAVINQVSSLMGSKGASAIQGMIANASQPGSSIPALVVGVIILLLGASGVFSALQGALNTIWEVKPSPDRGIWGTVTHRLFSFAMVLAIGFLLLVSLIVSTALSALMTFFQSLLPGMAGFIAQVVNFVVSIGVITVLFALIFKYVPDAEVRWRDVWIGALFTALLFTIGKTILGIYLGRNSVTSVYGAAGSLVIILLWVYYSAMILFFGAEFTQVYAHRTGTEIVPKRGAVRLTAEDLAHQGITRSAPRSKPSAQRPIVSGAQPVPVTSQVTLPTYRRYPQNTNPGLPPMPPGVKALTRVVAGLIAAAGVTGMMFARSRATSTETRLRKVGRRVEHEGVSLRKEGAHLTEMATELEQRAKKVESEASKMRHQASHLGAKANKLRSQGHQMETSGAQTRQRTKRR